MQLVFSEFRMNNILSLFHGYLGLLMDEQKLNPVMREGLTRIRDGAREATELMERINAISRPASCVPRTMDPADFFRQLAPTLDRIRPPQIQLAVECPEGLPSFTVDASRMKLAIVELVRNACEAATAQVLIRVSANKGAEQPELFPGGGGVYDGEWLKIEVKDDGAGIRTSEAKRIYEPFYSTKKAAHASGLGLAVALGCAQQFGGTLQHRSKKGVTIFEMSLPACASQRLSAVA
jgi:two-component system cell cycle sensor histidine kinase/response regulator CckA